MSNAWAQIDFFDLPPTNYSDSKPEDRMTRLLAKHGPDGLFKGARNGKQALRILLRELEIPEESQLLVFTKTSLQNKLIGPRNPRAIYFSENAYVGYVPGGVAEVIVVDRRLGPVFYAVHLPGGDAPVGVERGQSCMQCHATGRTEGVPGMLVRSVVPNKNGFPILSEGTYLTTHASPLEERWGGWYVTGTSDDPHLGNRVTTEEEVAEQGFPAQSGSVVVDLEDRVELSRFLQKTSDIVALMVLEHQCRMHNLLTKVTLNYHRMWYLQQATNAEASPEDPDGLCWKAARSGAEEILEELLFCRETELGGDGIEGSADFREVFEAGAPMSREGRSLRELRLYKRMFRYRCSYMIYSEAFDYLPAMVRDRVLVRLREILVAEQAEEKFDNLTKRERKRILEIVRDTLPGLPERW